VIDPFDNAYKSRKIAGRKSKPQSRLHTIEMRTRVRGLLTVASIAALLLVGATGGVAAKEGGVVACGSNTGGGSNAGATADTDEGTATVFGPDPDETQSAVIRLLAHLRYDGGVGPSILHVSANRNGEEQAGAGSDDLPNGGDDWRCASEPDTPPQKKESDDGGDGDSSPPSQAGVVACGSHSGDGTNGGVTLDSDERSASVIAPKGDETRDGAENFADNVANEQNIGNSVLHAGVNADGEEQVGAGSDDTHENDWECSSEPNTAPQPGQEDGIEGPHPPRR